MGRVLQLRSYPPCLQRHPLARGGAGPAIPLPSAQAARGGNRKVRLRGSLWGDGCAGSLSEAPEEPRACSLVKPVREPDAGDPQVRFDERRWETEPGSRLRHRRIRRKPPETATPSTYSHRARRRLYLAGHLQVAALSIELHGR